ncbi:sensor histidine kinase [Streptomyces sp. NPDC020192]|uniref:sensor histidine kinase n=1 Tax=Streptomyces sp. NPDC020192 TaxID=3365066 RepID=UPI00379CCC82
MQKCGLRFDAGAAAGFFVLLVALMVVTPTGPDSAAGYALALACAAVQAAAVAQMRRHPEFSMAAGILAGVGIELLSPDIGWLGQVAAVLVGYARVRPPTRSLWVLGLLLAGTPWKLVHGDWTNMLLAMAGPSLAWTLGELGRTRALRRQDLARRILTQERERIARELHDVLAHTVSVIVVQAGAAGDVFDTRPDLARKALVSIDRAARSTLSELRLLLQTMSPQEDPETDAPQPGLDQLDALATSLQATGLRVELERDAAALPLPAAVDLSAYRIVQESLTNTLRHSQATRVRVIVRHEPGSVRLEISDDGPARPVGRADGSGRRGIVGMRERARLLGGTLDAGPRPDGGFRVRAELPMEAA